MARKVDKRQIALDASFALSTAPCVPAIREAVRSWREGGYRGVTDTTRELIRHWFETEHRLSNGRPFRYHYFQREAIETLIYVWEVAQLRSRTALLERYAHDLKLQLPEHDEFVRYAVKMATGSGKTKVMALAIAWHYLNAIREENPDYAKTFLVIAPNIIVAERLEIDFAGGRIFQLDPVIPKHMRIFWDLECVVRGDGERASSDGALFLTNIQQLYERDDKTDDGESGAMLDVLGPKPKPTIITPRGFRERIGEREGTLLVINDEAHHTHDEGSEWNNVIRSMHDLRPITAQLDFSATPRFNKGGLFPWTVYDYPLKQAIVDNVVKRPVKGIANFDEAKSDIASVRYQGFLVAGVNRWTEYRDQLTDLHKKPILFVMMNDTKEADDVGDWLRTKYPSDFGGERTLVIHTRSNGEIVEKDLEQARALARRVDQPDCAVNAIVSVLMLREGWDVQNVTVIVGLRPYTAKANILPEQTIGRGLRLMFRDVSGGYTERVDVIGNPKFIEFVEELDKAEKLGLETFEVGKDKLKIWTIQPQPEERGEFDIGLPHLSPALSRKHTLADEIAALDVMSFKCPTLPIRPGDAAEQSFSYEGQDILTLETIVQREYTIPEPQTPGEVIGYYAKLIASDVKLPSQFAALVPKIRQFFEHKAFGRTVNLDDPLLLKAMSRNAAAYVVRDMFSKALKAVLILPAEPQLVVPERKLSTCQPFPYSRPTLAAKKTIFNLVPCDNELERTFARFLDHAADVLAFAKLPEQFGFAIEYVDQASNMRYYYPDFVARLETGDHWLIETKGAETLEVAHKDRAALLWCENATMLTGVVWNYLKVPQKEFERLQPADFLDLTALSGTLE
ncbi:MAG: DEAD/DEAH box helicase family protein [Herpetosiphonaceae bacterium]|nr:DEAD/DEAH box helicase family protein [Herpetosiphonaceae bacterium]